MKEVTLDTLGGDGFLEEVFQEEWEKLLANIGDPNTKPDAARELRLTIKVKPSKQRDIAKVSIEPTLKLAPIAAKESHVMFGFDGEKVTAYSSNPKQFELDETTDEAGRVISMEGK